MYTWLARCTWRSWTMTSNSSHKSTHFVDSNNLISRSRFIYIFFYLTALHVWWMGFTCFSKFFCDLLSSAVVPMQGPITCPCPTHPPASCTHPRSHYRNAPWSPTGSSSSSRRCFFSSPKTRMSAVLTGELTITWMVWLCCFLSLFSHACPRPPDPTDVQPRLPKMNRRRCH